MRSRAKPANPDAQQARTFRALADPTRLRILQELGAGELRAGDVAARFDVSRPAVSRHLRILRDAGLVTARKEGRERYYAVAPGPLRDAAAHVQDLDARWARSLERLGEHLARARLPRE